MKRLQNWKREWKKLPRNSASVRPVRRSDYTDFEYRRNLMTALIVSLMLAILAFRYWPFEMIPYQSPRDNFDEQEVIVFEDAVTVEQQDAPPPPSPRHPEPRPEDEIVEDQEFDFEDALDEFEEADLDLTGEGSGNGVAPIAENPTRPPGVRKIVEPSYSGYESRYGDRIRIFVSFLVNTEGRVEEVTIDEIQVYDEDRGSYRTIDQIEQDILDTTLDAAYGWQFRPAEEDGEPVRARSRHVFTYSRS